MPLAEQAWADLVGFCRDTIAAGAIPVLQAYALGKCQELLLGLAAAGLRVLLHSESWRMTRHCASLGLAVPPHGRLGSVDAAGHVVLMPPTAKLPVAVRPARTAVVTGWAVESSCRFRARTDAAFPLSDHADYGELLELVERVQPRRICTVHGFAREFAATLRARTRRARARPAGTARLAARGGDGQRRYCPACTLMSSTSKTSAELGPIKSPAPPGP